MHSAAEGVFGTPVVFGPAERRLCGWYHAPARPTRSCAVLLCPPIGWEALATHRTYRVLAEQLCEGGFPVLRFDLDGSGDSAGTDEDPQRVAAWLGSIREAAGHLKVRSGRLELAFFGIHSGATLAAQAASELGGVETLVLWSPYLQGRQLVREIRAYRALNDPDAPLVEGEEGAGGFLYLSETLEAFATLDLLQLTTPARRALLLQRDATSREATLATTWGATGVEVSCESSDGFAAMMLEPRKSTVPTQTLARVAQWLSEVHPEMAVVKPLPVSVPPTPEALVEGPGYREESGFFGAAHGLFGVLTRSTQGQRRAQTIVFVNTASDHRVGPSRMYVTLSRNLAAAGFDCFRFDPTGLGDNRSPYSHLDVGAHSQVRQNDLTAVLDVLDGGGIAKQFVLVGLCSGAYVAFHVGRADQRVVGEVLINPQTFVWHDGDSLDVKVRQSFKSSRYYKKALFERGVRKRLAAGDVNVLGIGRTLLSRIAGRVLKAVFRRLPLTKNDVAFVFQGFRAMLARGTDTLVIFGASDGGIDIFDGYVGANGGALRSSPHFRIEILDTPDHTFSRTRDQRTLSTLLITHLTQRFT